MLHRGSLDVIQSVAKVGSEVRVAELCNLRKIFYFLHKQLTVLNRMTAISTHFNFLSINLANWRVRQT